MATPTFQEKLMLSIMPGYLIAVGAYHFILTAASQPALLLKPSELRARVFARFWRSVAGVLSADLGEDVIDLLRSVRGTVLDVGPGSGELVLYLNTSQIDRVYGSEPTEGLHGPLKANLAKAGLDDKYRVLSCGAQPESLFPALSDAGLLSGGFEGIFDDICCFRVLCGVPEPHETVQGLYRLLKPGGRLIVHEHVVNPWQEEGGSLFSRVLQGVYAWSGWSLFVGCKLDRDVKQVLLDASGENGWSKVDLKGLDLWSPLPWYTGYLIKR